VRAKPDQLSEAARAWDVEYEDGRYRDEPPLPFVADILTAAREHDLIGREGVYIGCGNGRNYLPLFAGGLDLIGLDISATAIDQLAARAPGRRGRLIHGDLSALPDGATYALIVGIQVFQHGDRATAHEHIRAAQARLAPADLFRLRVNAVGTDLDYAHDVSERADDGGFTVRYHAGPKTGLDIHLFDERELTALFVSYEPILPPRHDQTWRPPPERGQWSQWEAIWRRPA
jgi:hypothetical protein